MSASAETERRSPSYGEPFRYARVDDPRHSANRLNEITARWREAWIANHPTPLEQWLQEQAL